MPKIKTSELTGPALDWAASVANGMDVYIPAYAETPWVAVRSSTGIYRAALTTDWAQGGPIIERERLEFRQARTGMFASYPGGQTWFGQTHLEAAMRCFVASKLGDEVDVPEELV